MGASDFCFTALISVICIIFASFIIFALRQHQQYHMSTNQSRENQKVYISDIYNSGIVVGGANTDYFTVFFFGNKLHSKQNFEQIHAISKRGVVFIFYHFFISSVCSRPKLTTMAWSICFIVLSSTVETYLPRRDLSIVLICSSSAINFFMPSAAKMICVGRCVLSRTLVTAAVMVVRLCLFPLLFCSIIIGL